MSLLVQKPELAFLSSNWELPVPSTFHWVQQGATIVVVEILIAVPAGVCHTVIALAIES